jgi:hypothetical protein
MGIPVNFVSQFITISQINIITAALLGSLKKELSHYLELDYFIKKNKGESIDYCVKNT